MSEHPHIDRASDEHAAELPRGVGLPTHRPAGRPSSPHSPKFMLATAMLAGIAVAAIAVAVTLLLTETSSPPRLQWSSWSPPDTGIAGEREIADEVAPLYRASPAAQLVVVTVRNISSTSSTTGAQLALRNPNNGSLSAVSGNSAVFTLCGLGPNCAISTGTPSAARLLLLRREALELALYTFKYIGGVDNVVAILPPSHTESTARLTRKPPSAGKVLTSSTVDMAVVFQRGSVRHFLDQKLSRILPEPLPPTVSQMESAPEAELVSVITGEALFKQQLVQTQDGSSVLVLDPLPPQ